AAGRVESLRELRYVDLARLDELAVSVTTALADTGRACVEFLSGPDAFEDYLSSIEETRTRSAAASTVAEALPLREWLAERTAELQTVVEVVTGLEVGDATLRTGILERVSTVLAAANRAGATVEARRGELAAAEGRAEFAAEYALLG